ncbi:MAG: site-specific integrase [Bdellovibrionaceae bacterium]|jgi:integrase|nr:site-specific integrase [Pseudobdellovibrionaceae bacterium]
MAIKDISGIGAGPYTVTVSVYSSKDRSLRKQKFKSGVKNLKEAKRIERMLFHKAHEELMRLELVSCSWGTLVEKWELSQRDCSYGRKLQTTTVIDRVNALRQYTQKWWNIPAENITRAMVREVFESMDFEGKSRERKKDIKAAMNSVFNWAIDIGELTNMQQSPASGFTFKKEAEVKPEILSLNEIRKLLQLAKEQSHPWYPVWAMALMTGMRSGELYALTFDDIDWENNRLMVSKSYSGRLKKVKSTKAGCWREVPLNDELISMLKLLRAPANGRLEVLPRLPRWANGGAAVCLRMFCLGNGLTSIKFHSLRACFATQLIRDAVAPAVVMKICGWKDIKTMQRYIRLAGIEIEGATEGLKILPNRQAFGRVHELFKGD